MLPKQFRANTETEAFPMYFNLPTRSWMRMSTLLWEWANQRSCASFNIEREKRNIDLGCPLLDRSTTCRHVNRLNASTPRTKRKARKCSLDSYSILVCSLPRVLVSFPCSNIVNVIKTKGTICLYSTHTYEHQWKSIPEKWARTYYHSSVYYTCIFI